jgi:hypothetical protein
MERRVFFVVVTGYGNKYCYSIARGLPKILDLTTKISPKSSAKQKLTLKLQLRMTERSQIMVLYQEELWQRHIGNSILATETMTVAGTKFLRKESSNYSVPIGQSMDEKTW